MAERMDQLVEAAEARWRAGWALGPTRLRWASLPPQPGDPAPDAVLPDHEGASVRLSSRWAEGPLLVLFWRHFGCSCGMDRAGRLRAELAGYRSAGGDVVIIGQGEPERAARYREGQQLDTIAGMTFSNLIAFFIILSTAATLHAAGVTQIETSAQAATVLAMFATL